MTYKEINTMTEELCGVPSAYYQFTDRNDIAPPFSVFYFATDNDFAADNSNYQTISRLYWELYTDKKDFELEVRLEGILASHGIVWLKSEDYDDTEQMHMTRYETDIVIEAEPVTPTTTEEDTNGTGQD